jgi:transposase
MARPRKYPPELLDRGARVVIDSGRPIAHVARDLGVPAETLRRYVRQVEADEGLRPDLPSSAEREEIKALRKEDYELRRANEILKSASLFFAKELDPDRAK